MMKALFLTEHDDAGDARLIDPRRYYLSAADAFAVIQAAREAVDMVSDDLRRAGYSPAEIRDGVPAR